MVHETAGLLPVVARPFDCFQRHLKTMMLPSLGRLRALSGRVMAACICEALGFTLSNPRLGPGVDESGDYEATGMGRLMTLFALKCSDSVWKYRAPNCWFGSEKRSTVG